MGDCFMQRLQKLVRRPDEGETVDRIHRSVEEQGDVAHGFLAAGLRELQPGRVPSLFGPEEDKEEVIEGSYRLLLSEPSNSTTKATEEKTDVDIR